jgi:hypothetical protein
MRWLMAGFLVVHGLIHAAIWLSPASGDAPFDVRHSPVFGDVGALAMALGLVAGAGFVASGVGYGLDMSWWSPICLASAAVSVGVLLLTFTPWWLLALAINVVVSVVAFKAATAD